MKNILRIGLVLVVFVLVLFSYTKIPNKKLENNLSLNVIAHMATANAETTCSATCEGGVDISISGCYACSAVVNQYVKCYDENYNLTDEKLCNVIA